MFQIAKHAARIQRSIDLSIQLSLALMGKVMNGET